MPTRSVMIVDDEADMRMLLRTVADIAGATVVGEATDGDEAVAVWEACRSAGRAPDVIVLDYLMPGRNGVDVAHYVHDRDRAVDLVMVSASVTPELEQAAAEAGARATLDKVHLWDLRTFLSQ